MKCPLCNGNIDVQLIKAVSRDERPAKTAKAGSASGDVGELLEMIGDVGELDEAAAKFVTETQERWEKYGQRIKFSDKQYAWLKRIADGENRRDDWN